jgi:cell division protein FtsQ
VTRPAAPRGSRRERSGPEAPERRVTREPRVPRAKPPRRSPATYRRRRLAAALVALTALVGIGFGVRVVLYDSGLLRVESVEVTGVTTITAADVRAAADVTTGAPLAGIDTAAIAARVAALPAVDTVAVGRSWPHTVAVAVVERVPVATVLAQRGTALVDRRGVVYAGTAPPGLPRLNFGAAGPDDPSTAAALAALAALPDAVRRQVLTIDATVAAGAPAQVTLGLAEARQVMWGTSDRGEDKARVLVPLLTEPGRVYDVSSPDLPTVRR